MANGSSEYLCPLCPMSGVVAHAHNGHQDEVSGAGFSQVNDPCQAQELRDRRQEECGHSGSVADVL